MSAINIENISVAHWYPDLERHKCGYCKNENGAVSYGMWTEQLTVEDYQNLIDRGWRRSGMYCYKPIMDQTCCPQYTIRCSAIDFKLAKSQKKIMKKFNKFLNDGTGYNKKETPDNSTPTRAEDSEPHERVIMKEKPSNTIDLSKLNAGDSKMHIGNVENVDVIDVKCCTSNSSISELHDKVVDIEMPPSIPKLDVIKKGVGADPSRPPCKKAKLLRLERKQEKVLQKGMPADRPLSKNECKTLEQLLNEIPADSKHKLELKLVSTVEIEEEMESVEYQLYKKYQMAVHNDPPEKCTMSGFMKFLVWSPLKIKHEHMNKNHKTFKVSAALFQKYQLAIHNEPLHECGEKQFRDFLIDTPLKSSRMRGNNSAVTFGTFHQQYWIDDKLIAVAVLDILPRSVSSVYFFYDPDYRFLSLGTYGSLREVQFVQSLHQIIPSIKFYYMGFYIHSCPKMRYKGKLSHSFLLCPETYQWQPIERCTVKLETNKYSRLNEDVDAIDENLCTANDINNIKVCVSYSFTTFSNYKQKYGEQDVFDNIGKLIGKKCASTLLFVSSKG